MRAAPPEGVDVRIDCADGYQLVARVFEPATGVPTVSAVIAPATGVKAAYYWRYAAFLAQTGMRVVVADYRGIGRSAPADRAGMRRLRARWHEWGTLDVDAVIGWVRQLPDAPDRLVIVGHSFGGIAAFLAPQALYADRLVLVGAQHAHWPDYAAAARPRMLWRWHLVMPLLTAVMGYFPGRRLGWLEDLPAGVAFDWARGRADLKHTIGPAGPAVLFQTSQLTASVLSVAAMDDPFATDTATARTLSYLPGTKVQHCLIDPAELGVDQIGHFGLFHDSFRDTLWPRSAAWLHTPPEEATP